MRVPECGSVRRAARVGEAWPWFAIVVLGAALVLFTGCGDSSQAQSGGTASAGQADEEGEEPDEDAIAVEVSGVTRGSLSAVYSTSATLRADKQATVTARTHGVVRELLVEEGDWIREGQPLAVLEDDEQRIAFAQAQATSENRRREYERAEQLHEQELLSEEEYETARRESVEAQHDAELAELELSRTVIRATFDGRVLLRHLDVGATVNDGTPVYDIADLKPLYADVQVPERQVAQLEPGQTVRLMTDEDGGAGEAEIERIAPAVDATTGTVKVTLVLRRADGLRPGSFVRVGIVTDTHDGVLLVPRSALVAEGRRWHLFRLKDGDERHVELIEVARGFEEGDRVEILDGSGAERPLREHDRVVVTGASSLSDGSAIEILDGAARDPEQGADESEEPSAETASYPAVREGRCVAA